MKGYLFIIMLGFVSCAKEIVITEDEIKPDIFYSQYEIRPYTGTCKIYYSQSDLIKEEFKLKEGRLHGESRSYHKNGNLMWKGCYCNGLMSGKWQKWDDAGNLIMELQYVNDVLDGLYIAMDSNGNVREKGNYSDNRRAGEWISVDETQQAALQ